MRQLYFRADTRNPKTIFKAGFVPRDGISTQYNPTWWQEGIRNAQDPFSLSPKKAADDAQMSKVVCLSKKLESTPLFPICDQYHEDYDSEMYIYIMALPDAKLPDNFNIPQDGIEVFDFEAYQIQEFKEIMENAQVSVNPAIAGYVLSGHEVFAKNVSTENIICAVKCKRSDYALMAGLPVYTKAKDDDSDFAFTQTRYFEIGHEVFVNDKYSQDEQYKNDAIEKLREVKAKGLQPTANVQDALDECGIEYNKDQIYTSTYFWQELTSLELKMAFFSVLESIYYAAIQLSKYITNNSEQKPIEIVENLPDSMEDAPKRKSLSFYGRYFTTIGILTGEASPMDAWAVQNMM